MSVLTKRDSEVSSPTQSSPSRSPGRGGRPVYYVQSPSRDSHDGEKTTNSSHSSPVMRPMGLPPQSHSNSSLGPHSRDSASKRFSGSRKQNNNVNGSNRKGSSWRPWKDRFDAIEEERLLHDDRVSSDPEILPVKKEPKIHHCNIERKEDSIGWRGIRLGKLEWCADTAGAVDAQFHGPVKSYVLGKFVKPKFYKRIQCSVVMDPQKMNGAITLKNKCTYH